MSPATTRSIRHRRAALVAASVVVPATLVLGLGHRGVHMARNLLFPGAGLIDEHPVVAVTLALAAVAATVGWLRWGADWWVVAVLAGAVAASAGLTGSAAPVADDVPVLRGAHEFPLVILVVTALTWLRSVAGRLPGAGRLAERRARSRHGLADVAQLAVVDRSRCAAIVALSGGCGDSAAAAIDAGTGPEVAARARRVGLAARGRRTGPSGDPFRVDHAHARAALALSGRLDAAGVERLRNDAAAAPGGVPASEPGWVRPLDGTLVAIALTRAGDAAAGERWRSMLTGPLSLHRGHRPAWWWTPIGVAAGSATAWEHAASTALARAVGWIGDDDWAALRAPVLGAAARGTAAVADERLVAAGRIWLALVDDAPAARIVGRPSVQHDPLAVALDRLATALVADPSSLVRPGPVAPATSPLPHGLDASRSAPRPPTLEGVTCS